MEKDEIRTGLQVAEIKRDLVDNLFYLLGKFHEVATPNELYLAVAYTVRDRLLSRWVKSAHDYYETKARTVCYLSPEFLIGPQLGMNLLRLNSEQSFRQALQELGLNLDDIIEHEEEPGLGNGGLGRLASCFLESMATLQVPAISYGIRYEFGIFDQELRDGWQLEVADQWLRFGNPWEIARPDIRFDVNFGGHTEAYRDQRKRYRVRWIPDRVVQGTPYDTAMLGYCVDTENLLRVLKAEDQRSFDHT